MNSSINANEPNSAGSVPEKPVAATSPTDHAFLSNYVSYLLILISLPVKSVSSPPSSNNMLNICFFLVLQITSSVQHFSPWKTAPILRARVETINLLPYSMQVGSSRYQANLTYSNMCDRLFVGLRRSALAMSSAMFLNHLIRRFSILYGPLLTTFCRSIKWK